MHPRLYWQARLMHRQRPYWQARLIWRWRCLVCWLIGHDTVVTLPRKDENDRFEVFHSEECYRCGQVVDG